MSEAYCGKNCETCAQREALGCAGCGGGYFSPRRDECAIADCCREKAHDTCATCTAQDRCFKLDARDGMAQQRLAKKHADEARHVHHVQIAPVFAKWLWVLFWSMIAAQICAILTNEDLLLLWPWMKWPGEIVGLICVVLNFIVLFKLSPYERQYRTAAWCALASIPLTVLALALGLAAGEWGSLIVILAAVAIGILQMYSNYKQYHAHAAVLAGLDDELSEKWVRLWKWTVYALLALGVGLLTGLVGALLGLIVLLVGVGGLLVVTVLEYIYTYRMVQVFRALANDRT